MRGGAPGRAADLLLLAATVAVAAPFLLALLVSLLEPAALLAPRLDPALLRPANYADALASGPFARWALNTIVVAGAATAGSLLTSILAAYAFARIEFKGREALFALSVATLMIPSHVTLIPNYLLLARLGLIDTLWALVLPVLGSGFVTFFLRQQFRAIPREYDEAAALDGAGHLRILWLVIVPLARPAIAAMALVQLLSVWTSFLWPLIAVTSEDLRTLEVGLAALYQTAQDEGAVSWPVIVAAAMIVMAPTLFAYVLAERHLVRGLAIGVGR